MDVKTSLAYLRSEGKAHLLARREGLFVIKATGDNANIINKPNFQPKIFY